MMEHIYLNSLQIQLFFLSQIQSLLMEHPGNMPTHCMWSSTLANPRSEGMNEFSRSGSRQMENFGYTLKLQQKSILPTSQRHPQTEVGKPGMVVTNEGEGEHKYPCLKSCQRCFYTGSALISQNPFWRHIK
jgi:hypothetical protein